MKQEIPRQTPAKLDSPWGQKGPSMRNSLSYILPPPMEMRIEEVKDLAEIQEEMIVDHPKQPKPELIQSQSIMSMYDPMLLDLNSLSLVIGPANEPSSMSYQPLLNSSSKTKIYPLKRDLSLSNSTWLMLGQLQNDLVKI